MTRADPIVLRGGRGADGARLDVLIGADGTIARLGPDLGDAAPTVIDLAGELVLPSFVDGHCHLDKTMLGDVWIDNPTSASIVERIAHEQRVRTLATQPIAARAEAMLTLAVSKGTGTLRSHVDVAPDVGLTHLEALLPVREAWRDRIDIQLVAFPQQGVLCRPGTLELLDAALAAGADVLGGIDPLSLDGAIDGQLDALFGLATRHRKPIDIHLHDTGEPGLLQLDAIAARTAATGMAGRVVVSHAHGLATAPEAAVRATADRLAAAGVAILTYAPGALPLLPLKLLHAAGVLVFAGNDNVRDPWSPYGVADMLERAMLIGYRGNFRSDADMAFAVAMASSHAARALGVAAGRLAVGAPADIVALPAAALPVAVVERPARSRVFKRGRLVFQAAALAS